MADDYTDGTPQILIVVSSGTVVAVFAASPVEVLLLDHDARPDAPPVGTFVRRLGGAFQSLPIRDVTERLNDDSESR